MKIRLEIPGYLHRLNYRLSVDFHEATKIQRSSKSAAKLTQLQPFGPWKKYYTAELADRHKEKKIKWAVEYVSLPIYR